jgi:hypothetical protein
MRLTSLSVLLCAPPFLENALHLALSTKQSKAVHVCPAQIALAFTTWAPQLLEDNLHFVLPLWT